MENLSKNQDVYDETIEKTKNELDALRKDIESNEIDVRVNTIKETISKLNSFRDLPIKFDFSSCEKDKITNEIFPTTLDFSPKLLGDKRYNGKELMKGTDPLIITLDNRKFTVTPDIGSISDIKIKNGKVSLEISKFGTVLKNKDYEPARMTRLLLLLRRYKGELQKDIDGTPRAKVHEIK